MESKTKKNVGGRPELYKEKVEPRFEEIKQWRKDGQTEKNMSKLVGVNYRSWCDYKVKYPQFAQILKESKEVLIENLEKTMFEMALGKIKITETKKYISRDKAGADSTKIEETVKELAPSVPLLIFSLKNLAPEKWNDNSLAVVDVNGAMNNMQTVFKELKNKLNTIDITKDKLDETSTDEDE